MAASTVPVPCSAKRWWRCSSAPPGRRHLREDVAFALLRPAHVGEHHVQILAMRAAGGEQAERRDAQPLLPGVGGAGDVASGDRAPRRRPSGRGLTANATTAPSANTGRIAFTSGRWLPPISGRLRNQTSPGASRDFGTRFRNSRTVKLMTPHVHGDVAALGDEMAVRVGQCRGEVAGLAQER